VLSTGSTGPPFHFWIWEMLAELRVSMSLTLASSGEEEEDVWRRERMEEMIVERVLATRAPWEGVKPVVAVFHSRNRDKEVVVRFARRRSLYWFCCCC